jgi:hypothetical protein
MQGACYYTMDEYYSIGIIINADKLWWGQVFGEDRKKMKNYIKDMWHDVYEVLYKTRYEDLPVMMGRDYMADHIIAWRLKVGR